MQEEGLNSYERLVRSPNHSTQYGQKLCPHSQEAVSGDWKLTGYVLQTALVPDLLHRFRTTRVNLGLRT